jgi:predicted DsbA family dithiol-disulfide isomerase
MIKSHSAKFKELVSNLNDTIEQTYHLEQTKFKIDNQIRSNKNKIIKAMGSNTKLDVIIDNDAAFRATKTTNTHIEFFPDKLKENLPKNIYKKIINKTVKIKDVDGLIKFLKGYGVPAKDFKSFIETDEIINADKIDNLIEMEELEINSLQGCYKVDFEDILKVTKTK